MDFALPFSMDAIMNFIFSNIWWFVGIGIIVYVVATYFKVTSKLKARPVNRAEIERLQFIERMKYNKTSLYKWFVRGNEVVGKIEAYREVGVKGNPEDHTLVEMLIKPPLISRLKIGNPLAKTQAVQLDLTTVTKDIYSKEIEIPEWVALDYYFGIYYDKQHEEIHKKAIIGDNNFRTDLNMLASIYFAKSQEQSTFDPEHAHELAMKEKELQIEMAKKQGKLTSI